MWSHSIKYFAEKASNKISWENKHCQWQLAMPEAEVRNRHRVSFVMHEVPVSTKAHRWFLICLDCRLSQVTFLSLQKLWLYKANATVTSLVFLPANYLLALSITHTHSPTGQPISLIMLKAAAIKVSCWSFLDLSTYRLDGVIAIAATTAVHWIHQRSLISIPSSTWIRKKIKFCLDNCIDPFICPTHHHYVRDLTNAKAI